MRAKSTTSRDLAHGALDEGLHGLRVGRLLVGGEVLVDRARDGRGDRAPAFSRTKNSVATPCLRRASWSWSICTKATLSRPAPGDAMMPPTSTSTLPTRAGGRPPGARAAGEALAHERAVARELPRVPIARRPPGSRGDSPASSGTTPCIVTRSRLARQELMKSRVGSTDSTPVHALDVVARSARAASEVRGQKRLVWNTTSTGSSDDSARRSTPPSSMRTKAKSAMARAVPSTVSSDRMRARRIVRRTYVQEEEEAAHGRSPPALATRSAGPRPRCGPCPGGSPARRRPPPAGRA